MQLKNIDFSKFKCCKQRLLDIEVQVVVRGKVTDEGLLSLYIDPFEIERDANRSETTEIVTVECRNCHHLFVDPQGQKD